LDGIDNKVANALHGILDLIKMAKEKIELARDQIRIDEL